MIQILTVSTLKVTFGCTSDFVVVAVVVVAVAVVAVVVVVIVFFVVN